MEIVFRPKRKQLTVAEKTDIFAPTPQQQRGVAIIASPDPSLRLSSGNRFFLQV